MKRATYNWRDYLKRDESARVAIIAKRLGKLKQEHRVIYDRCRKRASSDPMTGPIA